MKIRNEKKEGKVGIRRIKRTPTNVSLVNKKDLAPSLSDRGMIEVLTS
jgi:hypothetical protein